jgi:hypothetical protein
MRIMANRTSFYENSIYDSVLYEKVVYGNVAYYTVGDEKYGYETDIYENNSNKKTLFSFEWVSVFGAYCERVIKNYCIRLVCVAYLISNILLDRRKNRQTFTLI